MHKCGRGFDKQNSGFALRYQGEARPTACAGTAGSLDVCVLVTQPESHIRSVVYVTVERL
jgi:hypothetical protein